MSFITDLFSGGASKIVDSVGKVLDNVVTTKEEKLTLENEIKKAEMQYQLDSKKLDIDEQTIYLKDRDSARVKETNIQTSQYATGLAKNIASYLAIGASLLCFGMFYILLFKKELLAEGDKQILVYILGVLSGLLTQIYSYYFGSSKGSSEKNDTIASALNNQTTNK